ncbi:flagellar basal body P-ring formation chaperone FlgA [Aquabacterium sp. A7-Y]|uniref:flagellar basal body P-ring formation chaperone FlgA n=1 Tax=Aquabacterium sp. A7-Y TaxID=1349605 RepID=UPI00223CCAE8|nr:flagellar basal body P-ring formation chaperone FlgA [Aquabacterium sp. A7-Y]MCW7536534.1 flagellar basal body P-ring formation chaperone FlgA [Aquabacterium sp. A7-Y]
MLLPFASKNGSKKNRRCAAVCGATLLWGCLGEAVSGAPATPEDQVAQVARGLLDEQARREGLREPGFELKVLTGTRPLPPCPGTLEIETLDARHPARLRFVADCRAGDAGSWRVAVVVRAVVSAEVLVSTTEVPAGRPLQAEELALERRPVASLQDTLSDPEDAVGRTSRRPLKAGQPLSRRALVVPQLLRRGDKVQIVARHAGIEVSVAGEALEAGGRGEVVRVRNAKTGRVIQARITSSSTVEPDLPPAMPAHSTD